MKRTVLALLTIILAALPALGSITPTIQVQGILTDENGVPLPDATYQVLVELFDAETGGTRLYTRTKDIVQADGIFTVDLLSIAPGLFTRDVYMELTVSGEAAMSPRIRVYPVPAAVSALSVDPNYAVTSINDFMVGNLEIVGGNNVTVTNDEATKRITIDASTSSGGDDGDWVASGGDLYREAGRVFIGEAPAAKAAEAATADESKDPARPADDPVKAVSYTGKLDVRGENEGVHVDLVETDTATYGRTAVHGRYLSSLDTDGVGFNYGNANAALMGYTNSDGAYTFGLAAYNSYPPLNSGALLASDTYGLETKLVFTDETRRWGLHTNGPLGCTNRIYTEDLTVYDNASINLAILNQVMMPTGAQDGYILTSDSNGFASWAPPASVENDGDWNLSGSNVYRSGSGTVTMGTSSAHNYMDNTSYTTMQIHSASNPTLALDSKYSVIAPLYRWTMTGGSAGLNFRLSNSYSSSGVTAMNLDEDGAVFNNASGVKRIEMFTEADMDDGGSINLYGDQSTNPALMLDGRSGTGGGRITVLNGAANEEVVVITANHNNTGVGRVTTPVLEITGGSDLSEQFDVGHFADTIEPGMVVSIDPENPGRLALSSGAYDRRVAGVISGAGGVNTGMLMGQQGSIADGELPVALVGRVYVWADASDGPIEPGDLLTTSDRPGHAMKVSDHGQAAGAILGKAMTGLNEGQGLILTLVSLQ